MIEDKQSLNERKKLIAEDEWDIRKWSRIPDWCPLLKKGDNKLMIMVNGNWEQVKDLSDVLRIVSENIGAEFAHKVEEICGEPSEKSYVAYHKLQDEKDELEQRCNDYDDILESLDYLNEHIDKLEKYIDDNADGTDNMRGMEKAFEMIGR